MSPTRFGRRAVGDPRFVLDLREGRRPRARTLKKVEEYLRKQEAFSSESQPLGLNNSWCGLFDSDRTWGL